MISQTIFCLVIVTSVPGIEPSKDTKKPAEPAQVAIEVYLATPEPDPASLPKKKGESTGITFHSFLLKLSKGTTANSELMLSIIENGVRVEKAVHAKARIVSLSEWTYPVRVVLQFDFILKNKVRHFEEEVEIPAEMSHFMMHSNDDEAAAIVRWEQRGPVAKPPPDKDEPPMYFSASCLSLENIKPGIHPGINTSEPNGITPLITWAGIVSLNNDDGSPYVCVSSPIRKDDNVDPTDPSIPHRDTSLRVTSKDRRLPANVKVEFIAKGPELGELKITSTVKVKKLPSYFFIRSEDGKYGLFLHVNSSGKF